MDSKALKTALKEARDAIKNKEYAVSLKICKNILKSDKENYMALVFLGISIQEVGPREQAPHAFRKAIQASPDQLLAWNGLASYYEKDETDNASKELIPIYEKLLETERDVSKFNDICTKLVIRALKIQETSKTCEILNKLSSDEKSNVNIRRTAWLALASLLSQSNNLNPELQILYETTLSTIINDRSSVTCNFYKEYLKMLYKVKKFETLFNEAVKMHSIYESTIYPLEWICKIYVELSIEDNPLSNMFDDQMDKYCEKINLLQPDAVMATFVKGVQLFRSKKYVESRDELRKVVSIRSGLLHAWVLISECYLKLYCYNDALLNATKADKLLQGLTKENVQLQQKINNNLMWSLSKHSQLEKSEQAIELGIKLLDKTPNDLDILVSLTTACVNVKNFQKAAYYLERIKNENKIMYILLKAKIAHQQNKLNEALSILTDSKLESCEIFIEMGSIYWDLKDYESSLVPYLKAAKLDPNYYMSFVYLGKYYEHIKDLEKARRCYQKSFNINPKCMEAGVGLSNIYRIQKNWDANLALLQFITGTNGNDTFQILNADVRWAWLQLGLHYLEQEDYTKSIDCLRSVIRVDPNNGHYWECLADAYMARGSYTAAMKSYERAAELNDEDTVYPKLQSAIIKFMLGFHDEAKEAFEIVLLENKRYVPALKGLAENCLALAFDQQKNQLLGRSRANAQYALDQLTIALKERSDLSCLWKLTGDSCALVADLPDKYSYMILEASLAEGRDSEELVPLDKQQLYSLAARCYCKAITLTNTNILLWHDLATCYYSHACSIIYKEDERKQLLDYANAAVKHCVINNAGNWEHWNLLGVIALHPDVKNYALAQHSFIKAVTIDKNCAVAWSNLGSLYLMLDNVTLANKAYSQAQRAEPNYVNSWIGQALIAELMGHDDAMDLFRHSTQLNYHPQSALGYANWVCKTITNSPSNVKLYSIRNMHAIPVALDAMTWYIEHNPYNSCAWNMLGILRERLQFKNSTLEAYKRSLKLCDDDNFDNVLINCARVLVQLGKYDDAIDLYRKIKVSSFNDGCGLALALFKAERYEESYEAYDTTMNCLAKNENMQSHVLVALATMMYKFKGAEDAKTLLFHSTQLKPPSQWGLYATLALGLIHGDLVMAQLVLKELQLQPMKDDDPEIIYHYSILESLSYLRQGDAKKAIRSLVNSIHRHPGQAPLWQFLSILLLHLDAKKSSKQAANCAQVSIKLNRSQKDLTNILCLISLASCVSHDLKSALKSAQKAVHCYPDAAEGWAVLISVLNYQLTDNSPTKQWLKTATNNVKNNLTLNEELSKWFSQLCY